MYTKITNPKNRKRISIQSRSGKNISLTGKCPRALKDRQNPGPRVAA